MQNSFIFYFIEFIYLFETITTKVRIPNPNKPDSNYNINIASAQNSSWNTSMIPDSIEFVKA